MKMHILEGEALKQGYTKRELAKALKIDYSGLSRRLNGKIKWSDDEIQRCIKLLKLKPEEVVKIFFD